MNPDKALVWFRRDLRIDDHAALSQALRNARQVYCAFVFDTDILDLLENRTDRRVDFIRACIQELSASLEALGGHLIMLHGAARKEIPRLARHLGVGTVYANRDYEPAARARDDAVAEALRQTGIAFRSFKDQVVFETDEVMTAKGKPYSVFTPYRNAWLKSLREADLHSHPVRPHAASLAPGTSTPLPSWETLGFSPCPASIPTGSSGAETLLEDFRDRIAGYREARDFPARKGPSYLSAHLRFGTVSIRELARMAWQIGGAGAETWLSELIWRDFYFMILHHHPKVAAGQTFKMEFNDIVWPGSEAHFAAWCEGCTGYPLVDAAMRQLNQTGYMHNRLRMVAASFLVKDLLVDWRKGEAWFAQQLLDFDLAANNGGWQWAASTGCDAQPWFRIFNPVTQSERFDPEGRFIKRYVPELEACDAAEIHAPWKIPAPRRLALDLHYPTRIVDHATMRARALELYKAASR